MTSGNRPKVVAIIPARMASQRFPGKVIAPLAGKPLVWHVFDRTRQADLVDEVIVAIDDAQIANALESYGVRCVMTRSDHPSGTDRIAEVAEGLDAAIIVNVQGDEAMIEPATIDAAVGPLLADSALQMSTVCHAIRDPARIGDPNVVKVITDERGRALYFSRSPIPYDRDAAGGIGRPEIYRQHVGLYAMRREFLLQFAALDPTPLEKLERLEQLRALEHGYSIAVVETDYESIGVDTPEELAAVERALSERAARAAR